MYDNNPRMIQEEVGKVLTAPSFVARQDQQEVRDEGCVMWTKSGITPTRMMLVFLAAHPFLLYRLPVPPSSQALKSDLVRLIPRLNSDNFKW